MAYKRYIHKKGKRHGPYYYKNVRDKEGKVKSIYLGKVGDRGKNPLKVAIVFLFLLLIIISILFFIQNRAIVLSKIAAEENLVPFELDHILIKVLVKSEESIEKELRVMNVGNDENNVVIGVVGLSDIVSVLDKEFTIKPGQTKIVRLIFSSINEAKGIEQAPGVYIGKVTAKTDSYETEVPLIVEIESKNVLFDMNLNPVARDRKINRGESTTFEIRVFNLLDIESYNVDMEYFVKDINGNTIISENENVVVRTQASFFKTLKIPEKLNLGNYVFIAQASFGNSIGTASYLFEVESGVKDNILTSFIGFCSNDPLCWTLSIVVFLLIFTIGAYAYFFVGAYIYNKVFGVRKPKIVVKVPVTEKKKEISVAKFFRNWASRRRKIRDSAIRRRLEFKRERIKIKEEKERSKLKIRLEKEKEREEEKKLKVSKKKSAVAVFFKDWESRRRKAKELKRKKKLEYEKEILRLEKEKQQLRFKSDEEKEKISEERLEEKEKIWGEKLEEKEKIKKIRLWEKEREIELKNKLRGKKERVLKKFKSIIGSGHRALDRNNLKKADRIYSKLMDRYMSLPSGIKSDIFREINFFYKVILDNHDVLNKKAEKEKRAIEKLNEEKELEKRNKEDNRRKEYERTAKLREEKRRVGKKRIFDFFHNWGLAKTDKEKKLKEQEEKKKEEERRKQLEEKSKQREIEFRKRNDERIRQNALKIKRREEQLKIRNEIKKKREGKSGKFAKCHDLLLMAEHALERDIKDESHKFYIRARDVYTKLEYTEKKEIYEDLMKIYRKLKKYNQQN